MSKLLFICASYVFVLNSYNTVGTSKNRPLSICKKMIVGKVNIIQVQKYKYKNADQINIPLFTFTSWITRGQYFRESINIQLG
jgi:hypothetical protein